jgi:hypothetical protein
MTQQPPAQQPAPRAHMLLIELERVTSLLHDARARLGSMSGRYSDLVGVGPCLEHMTDATVRAIGDAATLETRARAMLTTTDGGGE